MLGFVLHIVVTAGLLMFVGHLVSGIEIRDGKAALFGALALGLANAVVRPILVALTFPITLLTLGLFLWVVNALMLMLAAAFVDGFKVENFKAAFWGSVLLGLLNLALHAFGL